MKNSLSPDALLFDMDGVLVDSLDSWWKSLNQLLKQQKQEIISKNTFIERYWGYTLQENLKKLGIDKKQKTFCQSFYRQYVNEVELFPESKKTLEKLKNYPKAIITNTPKTCTNTILEQFQIKDFFQVIITSDQIENGKPDPEMIYTACTQLTINPEDAVLIGDTQNDINAGSAAGCITIGIQTEADITIDSIGDLLKHIITE